jgi:hypothetical protein
MGDIPGEKDRRLIMKDEAPKTPLLNDRVYNILKFFAMILLPAVASLYYALAAIWHLPKAEEIVGSITVVDTLLGTLLGITTGQYNRSGAKYDGELVVEDRNNGKAMFSLELATDVTELDKKKEITFRVVPR